MNIWIALASLVLAGVTQVVIFSFFMGRLFETTSSLKRRIDGLEGKPIINNDAKLAAIDTSLTAVKENVKSLEDRIEERFKGLEGTFRNMVQLATSGTRNDR